MHVMASQRTSMVTIKRALGHALARIPTTSIGTPSAASRTSLREDLSRKGLGQRHAKPSRSRESHRRAADQRRPGTGGMGPRRAQPDERIHITERVHKRGIYVKVLDRSGLDLSTPSGRGILALLSSLAEDQHPPAR